MRKVDEKFYDKLTSVIGDYESIKPKNIDLPKKLTQSMKMSPK